MKCLYKIYVHGTDVPTTKDRILHLKNVFTVSFEMTEREVYGKIAQFTHLEGSKYNVSQLMMMMM